MKKIFGYLAIVLAATCLQACDRNDEVADEPQGTVLISISPEDARARAAVTDDDINTFRILMFDKKDSRGLRFNFYYDDMLTKSDQLQLKVYKGDFDIVFVANEAHDSRLHAALSGLVTGTPLSELESEYFIASSFNDTDYLPIAGIARNVKIIDDNKLQVGAGPVVTSVWSIKPYLKRLAVRIDLNVTTKESWVWDNLLKFSVTKLPEKVFLLEQTAAGANIYNNTGAYAAAREIAKSETDYLWDGAATKGTWVKQRIIVPSSVFADKTTENKAITIEAYLNGVPAMKATLGKNINASDFTSPRNTHYTFNGELKQSGVTFYVTVTPWRDAQNVDLE